MARRRTGQRSARALKQAALCACGCVLMVAAGCGSPSSDSTQYLPRAWEAYKRIYITADGNVVDPDRGAGETTSEGQGYAMLRAAWMRDERTFSLVFDWTERHLARPDGLYSWRWTSADGGKLLDSNSAADADQEIGFALVIASHAFHNPEWLERARRLARAIRLQEGLDVGGRWFPAAGNWAVRDRIVNLSYFVPYAYPYFARIDPEGRWETVVDTGYDLLFNTLKNSERKLIPDFMVMTRNAEPAALPGNTGLSRDFSSDAMRIYWRIAVDCRLHKRPRACADPLGADRLTAMIARDAALLTRYSVDGTPVERLESFSFYGAALPFLLLHAPASARAIRADRLSTPSLDSLLTERNRYYDANWVWFGLAAADGMIDARTPRPDAIAVR